jgi:hypothetical protein
MFPCPADNRDRLGWKMGVIILDWQEDFVFERSPILAFRLLPVESDIYIRLTLGPRRPTCFDSWI